MVLNIRAMGRQFLCGQVKIASAPRSGIKIIAVIKPTMRREEAARACQWRLRRGTFVFVLSAQPTSCVPGRSEEHTSELQSQSNLVCRLLLEKKKKNTPQHPPQCYTG